MQPSPTATSGGEDLCARPEASLLGLPVRRSRPANVGWCASGRGTSSGPAAPIPDPAAQEASPEAAPPARPLPPAAPARDLLSYWRQRRGEARFPSWSDLDQEEILAHWPNCVLLRWDRALKVPRLEAAFTEALRAAKYRQLEQIVPEIEYSPQVTEWLLMLGQEVARRGIPLNDVESFPALKGRVRYRATALPLGDPQGPVELVLCHLARA